MEILISAITVEINAHRLRHLGRERQRGSEGETKQKLGRKEEETWSKRKVERKKKMMMTY